MSFDRPYVVYRTRHIHYWKRFRHFIAWAFALLGFAAFVAAAVWLAVHK